MSLSTEPILHLGEHLGEAYVFQNIVSVTVTPKGDLYVLDNGQATIFKYDMEGRFRRKIGKPGQGPGELFNPGAIVVVGPYLWVADFGNGRIQIFKDDVYFKTVKLNNLSMPENLAVSGGRVYVGARSLIQEFGSLMSFDPTGTNQSSLSLIAAPHGNGGATASLWSSFHLTALEHDRLILGFLFDNAIMVINKRGKVLSDVRMDGLYERYEEKRGEISFPAGFAAMAFSEGPDDTILVAVCNQKKRNCGVVYRFDGKLKKRLQRWDLGDSIRFMKYESELGLLVTAKSAEVMVYAVD